MVYQLVLRRSNMCKIGNNQWRYVRFKASSFSKILPEICTRFIHSGFTPDIVDNEGENVCMVWRMRVELPRVQEKVDGCTYSNTSRSEFTLHHIYGYIESRIGMRSCHTPKREKAKRWLASVGTTPRAPQETNKMLVVAETLNPRLLIILQ